MSLLSRIHANQCTRQGCTRERAKDAALCSEDVLRLWRNELDRAADGSYVERRRFNARDETGSVRVA